MPQTREESSPPAQEEAHLRVRDEAFLHGPDEPLAYARADLVLRAAHHFPDLAGVGVAGELTAAPEAAGREGSHFFHEADEVFRLARKHNAAAGAIAVEQRADAYGVARRDKLVRVAVVEDERELCVEHFEHIRAVFLPERKQYLAVGAAFKVVFGGKFRFYLLKAVDLAVADHAAAVQLEGLHAARLEAHDGEAVEGEDAVVERDDAAVVRPARLCALEARFKGGHIRRWAAVSHNGAHILPPYPTL